MRTQNDETNDTALSFRLPHRPPQANLKLFSMPELPEVEVLVRHLRPLLRHQTIRGVRVLRAKVLGSTSPAKLRHALRGAKFVGLGRRGKYLCFKLKLLPRRDADPGATGLNLVGHLGMTGRMYLARRGEPFPKHAAVVLELGRDNFIFEDTRYFGRLTLDDSAVGRLGPEPLAGEFSLDYLRAALARSRQPIKVKLLDQALVAGMGNIYASEALFRARISPRLSACKLGAAQLLRLRRAIRDVLQEAIRFGSTVPLHHGPSASRGRDATSDGDHDRTGPQLFYFGRAAGSPDYYEERLRVYDREGRPCIRCGTPIRRFVQSARSTYYCPRCQSPRANLPPPKRGRNQNQIDADKRAR